MRRQKPLEERFWAKVEKTDGCWLWTGARQPKGYGVINRGEGRGRNAMAHRVAWNLANGEIPPRLLVLHACDNPGCVKPDHLFLGTAADNTRDMMAKARNRSGYAKLTLQQAAEIRVLAADGLTAVEIAKRYPVKRVSIWRVIQGRTFRTFNPNVPLGNTNP